LAIQQRRCSSRPYTAQAVPVGETDKRERISRSGDPFARSALFMAAHVMMTRSSQWASIKAWDVRIAQRRSLKKAKIAVARKLAVIMHRMWHDATPFRGGSRSLRIPAPLYRMPGAAVAR
jgi:hypothetical protein